MENETEIITIKQWDNYSWRIEKRNLDRKGESLSATGIANRANNFIVWVSDEKMCVLKGWRVAMATEPEP